MGGDSGAYNNIEGAFMAAAESENLRIILVGHQDEILKAIGKEFIPPEIEIYHAEESIGMADKATQGVRNTESSIYKGIELVSSGRAQGFVSMGNTGAVVASALIGLGRIEGILRPALMTLFPTEKKRPTVVLDVGASIDCKPEHLYQFAMMGSVYAEKVLDRPKPSIGLLSIGEESTKGNAVVQKVHQMLSESDMNFAGNVEGRDVVSGKVDIIVCDGFMGNILLKFAESTFKILKRAFLKGKALSLRLILGGFMLLPTLTGVMKDFDYREFGGAPLLGVRGNVIIGHGRSPARAIKNAILLAQKMALAKVDEGIYQMLQSEKTYAKSTDIGDRVSGSRKDSD